jgi:xylulokinase
VIEAQMMAMANHAAVITRQRVQRLLATGGASVNREILQVMADVFDAEVIPMASGNAAALGAALRAFHAYEHAHGRRLDWNEVYDGVEAADYAARVLPVEGNVSIYRDLRKRYAEFERTEAATTAEPRS